MTLEAGASRPSVLIVGAGPVGMTLANLLGVQGIRTCILEEQPALFDRPRAVGTDFDCLRAWQAAGLDEVLLPHMIPSGPGGLGMVYRDSSDRAFMEVRPTREDYGFAMGYGFIQPRVDRALEAGLRRFEGVELRFGQRVERVEWDRNGVIATGRDAAGGRFWERAEYLVACDGGQSQVRKSLGICMSGKTLRDRWLVLDTLEPDDPERDCGSVAIWCDGSRPTVSVPRLYGHRRWEFMALPGESEPDLLHSARIRELLARHTDPEKIQILRKCVVRFSARIADHFRRERVLLAGDAAHVTPPFAGQGLAMGIRDAFNLAWKLALVIRGHASSRLLDSYEQERRPEVRDTIRLALRLGMLMVPRNRLRARLSSGGIRLLVRNRRIREYLRQGGPRPKPRHRSGFMLASRQRGSSAGWMCHQPYVSSPGDKRHKLDRSLGPGFALLGFNGDPAARLSSAVRNFWSEIGTRFLEVRPPGSSISSPDTLVDVDGKLAAWLGDVRERILLIRPDRYVALDCLAHDANAGLKWLRQQLEAPRE